MLGEVFLIKIEDTWEEMSFKELMSESFNGLDFLMNVEKRLYTTVDDAKGNRIFDNDIVAEYGRYHNMPNKVTYRKVNWKPNHAAWLRGESERLTPANVKKYRIEVVDRSLQK